jgi:hypothetical protein
MVVIVAIAMAVIATAGPGMTGTAVAVAVMVVEVRSYDLSLDVAEELHGMRMFGGNFRKYIELGLVGKLEANVQYRYNVGTGVYLL